MRERVREREGERGKSRKNESCVIIIMRLKKERGKKISRNNNL